jgi:hypothetical protein
LRKFVIANTAVIIIVRIWKALEFLLEFVSLFIFSD